MLVLKIHPKIQHLSKNILSSIETKDGLAIINVSKIEIEVDESIKYYQRTSNYPDSKFFSWLSKEEASDPPSWAIFFGLVEEVPWFNMQEKCRATVFNIVKK